MPVTPDVHHWSVQGAGNISGQTASMVGALDGPSVAEKTPAAHPSTTRVGGAYNAYGP